MNRRTFFSAAAGLSALALAACSTTSSSAPEPTSSAADLLASHDLTGKSAVEVVDALEANRAARPTSLRASVKVDRVELTEGSASQVLTLPQDAFYLSIAPYATRTHECFFHNLGSCQGELVDTDVKVTITKDDGTVLVDASTKTHANGFVGFWLPRGIEATLTVSLPDGRRSAQQITTHDDAPTCLTTLQLV